MAGGKSSGHLAVIDGGASGSVKSLLITGNIDASLPYAWYGAMWSPTAVPMQAADLSSKSGLQFQTRGDGKTYRVMMFLKSKGMYPVVQTFTAEPAWHEVTMPWKAFGTDGKDVMAIIFAGGPAGGTFSFQVDEVTLR